jgi:hypothetical protein
MRARDQILSMACSPPSLLLLDTPLGGVEKAPDSTQRLRGPVSSESPPVGVQTAHSLPMRSVERGFALPFCFLGPLEISPACTMLEIPPEFLRTTVTAGG